MILFGILCSKENATGDRNHWEGDVLKCQMKNVLCMSLMHSVMNVKDLELLKWMEIVELVILIVSNAFYHFLTLLAFHALKGELFMRITHARIGAKKAL